MRRDQSPAVLWLIGVGLIVYFGGWTAKAEVTPKYQVYEHKGSDVTDDDSAQVARHLIGSGFDAAVSYPENYMPILIPKSELGNVQKLLGNKMRLFTFPVLSGSGSLPAKK